MEDSDFIAGFIAGEGHFGVTKNYQWKPYIQPRFSINLHRRDADILRRIASILDAEDRVVMRNDRPHTELRLKSAEHQMRLRDVLDGCKSDLWKCTDKYENYVIWCEVLEIHTRNDHTTTSDERKEMARLAMDLNKDAGHNNVDWEEFIERLDQYDAKNR